MESRRNFLKKAAYVAPLILTIRIRPAHASSGYQPPTGGGGGGGGGTEPGRFPTRWVGRA